MTMNLPDAVGFPRLAAVVDRPGGRPVFNNVSINNFGEWYCNNFKALTDYWLGLRAVYLLDRPTPVNFWSWVTVTYEIEVLKTQRLARRAIQPLETGCEASA